MACYLNKIEICNTLLLVDGIDVNRVRGVAAVVGAEDEGQDQDEGGGGQELGVTPLFAACHGGHTAIVELLLAQHGIEVNKTTQESGDKTPLFSACYNGHTGAVKLLLNHREIDINAEKDGKAAFFGACFNGHVEIVKLMLANSDRMNDFDDGDYLPGSQKLAPATLRNHKQMDAAASDLIAFLMNENEAENGMEVRELKTSFFESHPEHKAMLEEGKLEAMCNGTKSLKWYVHEGVSAIFWTAKKRSLSRSPSPGPTTEKRCREMRSRSPQPRKSRSKSPARNEGVYVHLNGNGPADINEADGATPFFVACANGHAGVVEVMLGRDHLDVNSHAIIGAARDSAPLYAACCNGRLEVVKLLLDHGLTNQAKQQKMRRTKGRQLIALNGVTTADGIVGIAPLYAACHNGHAEVVQLLLEQDGIDVNNARQFNGSAPLHAACYGGHAHIVKLLLARSGSKKAAEEALKEEKGTTNALRLADVNKRTLDGRTPLYVASSLGDCDIMTLLLMHSGLKINDHRLAQDNVSPLHGAAHGGHLRAAQILVLFGASLAVLDRDGNVPAQIAEAENHQHLAKWLFAVTSWPRLRVAAGCRLYKEAAYGSD